MIREENRNLSLARNAVLRLVKIERKVTEPCGICFFQLIFDFHSVVLCVVYSTKPLNAIVFMWIVQNPSQDRFSRKDSFPNKGNLRFFPVFALSSFFCLACSRIDYEIHILSLGVVRAMLPI